MASIARSIASQLSGGTTSIVGNSIHSAPSSARAERKPLACSLARVTTIRFAKSDLVSNQLSFSLRWITLPTTIMAGGVMPLSLDNRAISLRVPLIVFCSETVPLWITATGVSGVRPCSISLSAICGKFPTPMRKTRVPTPVASLSHAMSDFSFLGSSWPVMKATVEV